jgi:hypothetical protein
MNHALVQTAAVPVGWGIIDEKFEEVPRLSSSAFHQPKDQGCQMQRSLTLITNLVHVQLNLLK